MPTATDLRPRPLAAQLAWWKEQLAGGPDALELPCDRPRSAARNFRAAVHSFALPKNLADAADALSRSESVTTFATLLAAFQTLLHRYTGVNDLLIGTTAAPPSTNTLALRLTLHGATSVREVLARTDQTARDAFANQGPPFALVRAELPDGPVFQVAFALQPVAAPLLPNFKCDLALAMTETSGGLEGRFHYNAELFDAESVLRMAGHFQMLLEAMVADPARPISLLPLLTEAERRQLLVEWNQTAAPFPRELGVHQLFEAQVARTPDAIAAVCGDQQITYRELNRRANQLAHHLRGLGVGPDVIVGLGVERSLDLVVALLGVLKAGGAYLFLDAAYPKERLAFMATDASLKVFLTQQSLASTISLSIAAVKMDSDSEKISRESDVNPENQTTGAHLAYAIYTSGSTGRPKGVLIRHDAFINLLTSLQREPGLTARDAMLALTTLSFDISNLEILLPLVTG